MSARNTRARDTGAPATIDDLRTDAPRPTGGGGDTTTTDQPPAGGSGLTRITVNLTRQAVQALDSASEASGTSRTDTINRALRVNAFIQSLLDGNGGSIVVVHDNGEKERITIV
jgi:hypothetical protein